jgi:hypothetical protein
MRSQTVDVSQKRWVGMGARGTRLNEVGTTCRQAAASSQQPATGAECKQALRSTSVDPDIPGLVWFGLAGWMGAPSDSRHEHRPRLLRIRANLNERSAKCLLWSGLSLINYTTMADSCGNSHISSLPRQITTLAKSKKQQHPLMTVGPRQCHEQGPGPRYPRIHVPTYPPPKRLH